MELTGRGSALAPFAEPVTWILAVGAITLSRLDANLGIYAALLALAALGFLAIRPSRVVGLGALLPLTAWIVSLPPWGALSGAVILAVGITIMLGPAMPFEWGRGSAAALVVGIAAGSLSGLIAGQLGLMATQTEALAAIIVIVAFRVAMIHMSESHWAYGAAVGLCALPLWGAAGLLVAVVEVGAGVIVLTSPSKVRLAWAFGAPAVLVGLI